ncbi:hypothetical protein [Sphingomonas faeni]|uniref:hypothetical protein n=1 Tax=Sphingomonas faeni TaxID=185950 RepID=UPI003F6A66A6
MLRIVAHQGRWIALGQRDASAYDIELLILATPARRAEGLQRFTEACRALARLPATRPSTPIHVTTVHFS